MNNAITIKFGFPLQWPAWAIRVAQSVLTGEAELTMQSQAVRNWHGGIQQAPSIDPTGNNWLATVADDRMSITVRYRYTLDSDLRDALAKVLAWILQGEVEG